MPPNFAQDAPVTLADRIANGGAAPQEEPTGSELAPYVMGGTGDPYKKGT